MRNIKLTVQYDGTNYHGFQVQAGTQVPTIQGTLEQCITQLTKETTHVIGAGRTDAGVHAWAQVVNFHTNSTIPIERFPQAVNSRLPKDIVAIKAEEVPIDFHASFSATGKVYIYTIYNSRIPPVFERQYSYHVPYHLDLEKMQQAAANLIGFHDFAAFRAAGSNVKTSERDLRRIEISNEGPIIKLTFEANGFLYNMVRIITGTLIEAGRSHLTPAQVKRILQSKDRVQAGPTAPAKGLCLEKVIY